MSKAVAETRAFAPVAPPAPTSLPPSLPPSSPPSSPPSVPAGGPVLKAEGNARVASALLRRKTIDLFRHFPHALIGDVEAIHQLRVSGRRLRVALTLLPAKPDGRRVGRARALLRQLTRAAGSSRDLDVLLESYDGRLEAMPAQSAEQKLLRRRLASARRRSRARMVESLLDLPIAQVRADLTVLIARGGPPPSVLCERFAALSTHEFRLLQEGFVKLGPRLDPEELHALRRRARRVRYAVEVFDQVRNFESAATKPWKVLQDLIGAIHDQHVLASWFDTQAKADRAAGKHALAATASDEAECARSAMHQLHARFLAADPIAIVARGLAALGQAAPSD